CAIRTIASSTHTIPTQYDHSVLPPIPVDKQGMQTNLLPADKRPRFVFVTPSHQFPLGGLLPIQRRIQLIQFVRMSECFNRHEALSAALATRIAHDLAIHGDAVI